MGPRSMHANLCDRRAGFALMDAMMAILVIGIGLFGIIRLNAVMLAGTAIGKTRAEATQLAEGKLEEIRTQQPPATKPLSSTSPEITAGVNATFARSWTLASAGLAGLDLDRVGVCLSWDEQDPDCHGGSERQVELDSLVGWANLATSGALGGGQGGIGASMPETPGGRAKESGEVKYTPGAPPAGAVSNPNDGTSIYQQDGKTELIETASGRVLLRINDGSDFSAISGKVYLSWGSTIAGKSRDQIDRALIDVNVRVLGSQGSVCRQYLPGGANTLPLYPEAGTTAYSFFHYICYMGAGWWGNIAVIRFDDGDRVCLGDPVIPQTDTSPGSRRPFLSAQRNYRGYTTACAGNPNGSDCKATGIGIVDSVYKPVMLGSSATATQHHFLLTRLTGEPSHADCATQQSQPSLGTNPFTTIGASQGGNAGLLYCLSSTCIPESGSVTNPTTFTMTINTTATTAPLIKVDGGRCLPRTQANPPFVYDCRIDWTGWSGDHWSGDIHFLKPDGKTQAGQLNSISLNAVQPKAEVVRLGGASGAGCAGQCIAFSSVPRDVISFALSATFTPLP